MSVFFKGDCMDVLHSLADKTIDLAIVDPPYGISLDRMSMGAGGGVAKHLNRSSQRKDKCESEGFP